MLKLVIAVWRPLSYEIRVRASPKGFEDNCVKRIYAERRVCSMEPSKSVDISSATVYHFLFLPLPFLKAMLKGFKQK